MIRSIAALIAGRRRDVRPASRTDAAAVGKSNSMSTEDSSGRNSSAPEDAPTRDYPVIDDRPQLVAHDVSDVAEGRLIAFYDPDGDTMDGEILYTRATVKEGDWR